MSPPKPVGFPPLNLREADRTILEDACRCRSAHYSVDANTVCARALGKFPMLLDKSDLSFTPHIVFDGYWQIWLFMAMAKLVRPGWRCIDVGANAGFFTFALADLAGPTGHVTGYEPQARQAALLQHSAIMNSFEARVSVRSVAAGDQSGRMRLHYSAHNQTLSSLVPFTARRHTVHDALSQEVDIVRLDDEFPAGSRIDLLKIDAEGFDYQVLEGASRILTENPQCYVIFEHSDAMFPNAGLGDKLDALLSRGYGLWAVGFDGNMQPTRPADVHARPDEVWDLVVRKL